MNNQNSKSKSILPFLHKLFKLHSQKIHILIKFLHRDNYISDDLMFVLEEDIAEQINLGVKLEIKKLKKELSIEII